MTAIIMTVTTCFKKAWQHVETLLSYSGCLQTTCSTRQSPKQH